MKIKNEEREWDFYLHKVFDKSYAEWKSSLYEHEQISKEQIGTTVKTSQNILNNFVPT